MAAAIVGVKELLSQFPLSPCVGMVTMPLAVGARLRLKRKVNLPQLHAEALKHLSKDGIICQF